jgi:hypothetical protein
LARKKEKRNRHKPKIKSDLNPEALPFIPRHLDLSFRKDLLENMFDHLEKDRINKIEKIEKVKSAGKRALKCKKLSNSPFKNVNGGEGGNNDSVPVENMYIQLPKISINVICMMWFSLLLCFIGCPSYLTH